ncbi:MAG: hypothetical protein IJ639_09020 [Ruminococcus sp.]|nr:hypothetical protein [Ruminococcus sp.]
MIHNRNERLAADYREMLKIQNRPYLSWIATKGEPPYAEEYLLTVRIRTYVFSAKHGVYTVGATRRCTIQMTLRDSYPHVAPYIKMLDLPPVFHPNWYSKGTYCPAERWHEDDSLLDYVKRMVDTLRYEPSSIKIDAPANYKALEWYLKNRENSSLFPADTTELTENEPEAVTAMEKAAGAFEEIVDSWNVKSK